MASQTYAPVPWLAQPSSGFDLFIPSSSSATGGKNSGYGLQAGPADTVSVKRRIAHRGDELLVAVGKEVRWAHLPSVKTRWDLDQKRDQKTVNARRIRQSSVSDDDEPEDQEDEDEDEDEGPLGDYKVLALPVRAEIQQLLLSPNQNLLAIVTNHTCHIAVLPDSSMLSSADDSPVRTKTFTLGAVTHAADRPPLCTALWHPLGKDGNCLLTITAGGIIRMWELNVENRWSFEEPALKVDLLDLNGSYTNTAEIGSPLSQRRGFTPDAADFELTSACFGSDDDLRTSPWSPMTLWVTTSEADVYALCPFVPSTFILTAETLDDLVQDVVAASEAMKEDPEAATEDKKLAVDRVKWVQAVEPEIPGQTREYIVKRPDILSTVPKLQGPFDIEGAFEEGEVASFSDIFVFGGIRDTEEDEATEEEDNPAKLIELDTICLVTETGRVLVTITPSIGGQWLKKSSSSSSSSSTDLPTLLTLATFSLSESSEDTDEDNTPTASPSFLFEPTIPNTLLMTYSSSLTSLTLTPFFDSLSTELADPSADGTSFRLSLLTRAAPLETCRLSPSMEDPAYTLTGLAILEDLGIGQTDDVLLLASTAIAPLAMLRHESPTPQLALPPTEDPLPSATLRGYASSSLLQRPLYIPHPSFSQHTALFDHMSSHANDPLLRRMLAERPLRLSSASLKVFLHAHRTLAVETGAINRGAADMFRRIEQLGADFATQIRAAGELVSWVEQREDELEDEVQGEGGYEDGAGLQPGMSRKRAVRLAKARDRQEELIARFSALSRKVEKLKRLRRGGELSAKEKEWVSWIAELERDVLGVNVWEPDLVRRAVSGNMSNLSSRPGTGATVGSNGAEAKVGVKERFEEAMRLGRRLVEEAGEVRKRAEEKREEVGSTADESAEPAASGTSSRRTSDAKDFNPASIPAFHKRQHSNADSKASFRGSESSMRSSMRTSRAMAMKRGSGVGIDGGRRDEYRSPPTAVRREKMEVIGRMLEREGNLVAAAQEKLRRLTVAE